MKKPKKDYVFSDAEVAAVLNQLHEKSKSPNRPESEVVEKPFEFRDSPIPSNLQSSVASQGGATPSDVQVCSPLSCNTGDGESPPKSFPKWYQRSALKKLKQELILKTIEDFSRTKTVHYQDKNGKRQEVCYQEDSKTIEDYKKYLQKLSIKQLLVLGKVEEFTKFKHTFMDMIHKFSKKERSLVRIIWKNRTTNDFIVSQHSRLYSIRDMSYLRIEDCGIQDNKYGMTCWTYYEGNPFPINYHNDYKTLDSEGRTIPDAGLLKKTMKFEYAEQLASSNLDKNVNLAMIFSILSFIMGVIILVCLIVIMKNLEIV